MSDTGLKTKKDSCHQGAYSLKEWQKIYITNESNSMSVRPALFLTKYPRRIQVLTSSRLCDSGPLAVEAASTALSRVAATMWAGDQQNVETPGAAGLEALSPTRGPVLPWDQLPLALQYVRRAKCCKKEKGRGGSGRWTVGRTRLCKQESEGCSLRCPHGTQRTCCGRMREAYSDRGTDGAIALTSAPSECEAQRAGGSRRQQGGSLAEPPQRP